MEMKKINTDRWMDWLTDAATEQKNRNRPMINIRISCTRKKVVGKSPTQRTSKSSRENSEFIKKCMDRYTTRVSDHHHGDQRQYISIRNSNSLRVIAGTGSGGDGGRISSKNMVSIFT